MSRSFASWINASARRLIASYKGQNSDHRVRGRGSYGQPSGLRRKVLGVGVGGTSSSSAAPAGPGGTTPGLSMCAGIWGEGSCGWAFVIAGEEPSAACAGRVLRGGRKCHVLLMNWKGGREYDETKEERHRDGGTLVARARNEREGDRARRSRMGMWNRETDGGGEKGA